VLEPAEFRSIVRHPVLTFEVLEENLERVPAGARMVAYQIHERCDGSGYPRGRTGERIHELAKIAAVADTYVALVSPRPHRRGLVPYFAVETILRGVREGLFDARVARGLLRCVSLFPIGSYVALSDGRVGRVIRSAGEHFDRPVLESWPRNNLDHQPAVLDLAAEPELRVVRPLARLR
jgi:HD-GYP domain-containing protein (c-di-GMP phosphodiesterase class II)